MKKPSVIEENVLCDELKHYLFGQLKHQQFTAVQKWTMKFMLRNYDCIVQAPTGSGKSLAFLLSTMQIISGKRRTETSIDGCECEVYALIIVPSRELVSQLVDLLLPVCRILNFNLIGFYGGAKSKNRKRLKGQCVIVATPGAMETIINKTPAINKFLKPLEVLIIDEADRFSDWESRRSITAVLSILPKQRRTSLFSATQCTEIEEIVKFGLRNPVRLKVSNENEVIVSESLEEESQDSSSSEPTMRQPRELSNYYMGVEAGQKVLALLEFLTAQSDKKILVFFCSAAIAEYFSTILMSLSSLKIMTLHRKIKDKRKRILNRFRAEENSILFSTDLIARGIDVKDIDWVVQFDLPRRSELFLHRTGRSGRNGRIGRSLIILTREELQYLDFIQSHEGVNLEEWKIDHLNLKKATELRSKIQDLAIDDRMILEMGSRAFVSYVEAYSRHDCSQIVCRFRDLDIVGIAHSFGLIRLPRMVELDGLDCLHNFQRRNDIRTSKISYKNEKLEERRKFTLEGGNMRQQQQQNPPQENIVDQQTRKRRRGKSDWDELEAENRLIKKFKKGKLNKEQLNCLLSEV